MESNRPKVEFYVTRSFSEKLTATFNFLRETWRPMLKYFFYLMLPVSIVWAFFMNHFWSGYMSIFTSLENVTSFNDEGMLSFLVNSGLTGLVYLVAWALLLALVYAMVRLYRRREDRLEGLTTEELRPEVEHCLKRAGVLVLSLVVVGAVAIAVLLGLSLLGGVIHPVLGVMFMLLSLIALVAVLLPVVLTEPVYLMEDETGIIEAYRKAFRLGFQTWGGIFGVYFIIGILANVLQSVTMGPWYLLFLVKMIFTTSSDLDGSFTSSFLYTSAEYLACVLQCLGILLSLVITTVAMTVQYGHASDKIDGVGVAQNIEKFDEFDNF